MKKVCLVVLYVLLCLALVIPMGGLAYSSLAPNVPPAAKIDPATQDVDPAVTLDFQVDVAVDPQGAMVGAGNMKVTFDPAGMQVNAATDVVDGNLFGGPAIGLPATIDNAAGTIEFSLTRMGPTTVPTPAGKFATIKFKAKNAPGPHAIALTEMSLSDETGAVIPGTTTADGQVVVLGGPLPPTTGEIKVTSNQPTATWSITGAASYNDGVPWTEANAPEGVYTIVWDPIAGQTKPVDETQTLTAGGTIDFVGTYTVATWTHCFADTQRGTKLCIDTLNKKFQLTGPGGYDSGVLSARMMKVYGDRIWMWHMDKNIHMNANGNIATGYCYAYLWDFAARNSYQLLT